MSGFDNFVESTPSERNDYAGAMRKAITALKADTNLKGYVITPADLARETAYNVGGCFKGLDKCLKATSHRGTFRVAKGKVDGENIVAIIKVG